MKTVSREEACRLIASKIAASGRKVYESDVDRIINKIYALPNGAYWLEAVEALSV